MNTTTEKPKISIEGVTFFPVPVVPSFAPESAYFPRRKLPDVPREFEDMVQNLFFNGGALPEMSPLVDRVKATAAVREWLRSWSPAHEVKTTTVAYALWVWCDHELLQQNAGHEPRAGDALTPKK